MRPNAARAAEGAEEDPEVMAKKAAAEEEAKRVEARSHGTHVTVRTCFLHLCPVAALNLRVDACPIAHASK